jgi:hypothetical protein
MKNIFYEKFNHYAVAEYTPAYSTGFYPALFKFNRSAVLIMMQEKII